MANEQAKRLWDICKGCALTVAGAKPPTTQYAEDAARLLFGTCAQESGLQWERQRGPKFDGNVGGFGKWQVEIGSIKASLEYLRTRPDVLAAATRWLFNDPGAQTTWVDNMQLDDILWALRLDDNDRIGALFCRLHYFRVQAPIPHSVVEQAGYWKKYYNTSEGKGTPDEYRANWNLYCAGVAGIV